jgi:hypothetical protein
VGLDSRNGVIGAKVGITAVDPNLKMPYAHNWFLGVQRNPVSGIVIDANYLGSAGRNLHNAYNINRYVGDLVDGRLDGFNPSFSTINFITSTSQSIYHGGTVQVRRTFHQGFMAQGSYTFGRAMDDADIAVGTTNYQDASNIQADRAIAGYDATHKVSLVGLWELPFLKDGSGPGRAVLGGWQLAGFAIIQSGTPLNITNSAQYSRGDFNADGNTGDRPNAPASTVKQSGWSTDEYLSGIFRVSDFPTPAGGQNGTLPRNAFRGPGFAQVDLSLSKKFMVTTTVSAEFRLNAFNAFNRVNLGDPDTNLNNNTFGRSTSQLAPRALQIGLRVRY